jgi:hypothetical protein
MWAGFACPCLEHPLLTESDKGNHRSCSGRTEFLMALTTLMQARAEDVLRGKKLVFLVGAPRSGTTWLQLLLSRSPSVVTAQETDLFNIFLRPIVDEWNRYRKTGEPMSLSELLSVEDFRILLRSVSAFVFATIAQRNPSASVVLEKTPNHVCHWREILDLWPDAHFIHIIRDPRAVVASLRAAATRWGPQWGSSRIPIICERWISEVSDGRKISSATPNYQEVLYQELVANGPEVLMRLLNGLGVTSSLEECHRYLDECGIENLKAGKLDRAPFDMARIGEYRFRTGATAGWRTELSKWEIAIVERRAGALMSELGFALANGSKAISIFAAMRWGMLRVARVARRRLRGLARAGLARSGSVRTHV